MRLTTLQQLQNPTPQQIQQRVNQEAYRSILDAVGEHIINPDVVEVIEESKNNIQITTTLQFHTLHCLPYNEDGKAAALQFLYPAGLPTATDYINNHNLDTRTVLAFKNEAVDDWNTAIQLLNPAVEQHKLSYDKFADVDDEHGYLSANLSTSLSKDFSNSDVPPHDLCLKVNDICLITRNLHALNLPSNSRVRILRINPYSIIISTMGANPRTINLPRINFKFKLK
jgi:hypothetical protein